MHGTEGVGKSTFASHAPKPIFIQCEDGLDEIDCEKFPLATSYDDVVAALTELRTGQHEYETVVVDSVDWLERLIWDKLCSQYGVNSIEQVDGGYAKGYTHALMYWREIVDRLNVLRNEKGMVILLIAHSKVERFEDPESSPYDRYSPRLHKHAAALLSEWSDAGTLRHKGKSAPKARMSASTANGPSPMPSARMAATASCGVSAARHVLPRTATESSRSFLFRGRRSLLYLPIDKTKENQAMADLRGFDANQVEPTAALDPVPAGKYPAVITESEMKPTKNGAGSYLQLTFQVIEGGLQEPCFVVAAESRQSKRHGGEDRPSGIIGDLPRCRSVSARRQHRVA